ncbi:MAG: hypothetical protein AAFY16_00195 [Cyanobacteria bacterium J06642_3]
MENNTVEVVLVKDINPEISDYGFAYSSYISDLTVFGDRLFFIADNGESGSELFVSDGTAEGTQLLVDINPEISDYGFAYGSYPSNLTVFNDELFFTADNGETGTELFKLIFDDLDVITGTSDADDLDGGEDDDTLDGLGGDDAYRELSDMRRLRSKSEGLTESPLLHACS